MNRKRSTADNPPLRHFSAISPSSLRRFFWRLNAADCRPASAADSTPKTPLAAVKKFLASHYPDKTWTQGPARMQNAAINQAYRERAILLRRFQPGPDRPRGHDFGHDAG